MRRLPPGKGLDSVFMQFKDDYRAWKAKQPETVLPDLRGWTDESLAYLRERYAGDLSAYEVYDALETMKSMGAISQDELNAAAGSQFIVAKSGIILDDTDPNSDAAWLRGFDEAPMVSFRCLEDILSWMDDIRNEGRLNSMTAAM